MARFIIKERHKEYLIFASVWVACGLLAFSVMVKPVFRDISWLRQEIRTAGEKIKLYRETLQLNEKIEKLESVLADRPERSMLIARVSDLAGKSGVEVQGINPKIEAAGQYEKLRMEVDFKSYFFGVLKMLQEIQSLQPLMDVQEISLTQTRSLFPESTEGDGMLQGKLVIMTYLKQEKEIGE